LAKATATLLLSQSAKDPARAAQLVETLKHPDLNWLEAEGEGATRSIKVETIRELLHTLSLAPIEGRHRVAVINDAHLVTEAGKNAILKTLEEPNPSVVIILIAPSVDTVLPTITSRCQILNLRPVPIEQITAALQARGVESNHAQFLARLSRGRVGWAINAIQDESVLAERKERLDQLEAMLAANRTQRFAFAEKLARRDGPEVLALLEEWTLFWRDVVQHMSDDPQMPLRNSDYQQTIRRVAECSTLPTISSTLHTLAQTSRYLQQNVNARLALDVLMLKLPIS
jgi:DNA polymerase-3 subunit delta'